MSTAPEIPVTYLSKSGLQVSRICFGTMSFGHEDNALGNFWAWTQKKETVVPLVKRAIAAGINFFDTANFYSAGQSEIILGEVIKELKVNRDDIVIATKCGSHIGGGSTVNRIGRSRKIIMRCIDESLKRLGTDYIDLYIIHTWAADTHTSTEETMGALNDLVTARKVRYIGVSNIAGWQLYKANCTAERNGWARFISVQNLYNPIYREDEREVIPSCIDLGVAYTPFSPLHSGYLAGNRKKGEKTETTRGQTLQMMMQSFSPHEKDWPLIERIIELAAKKGVTPAQLSLAWSLSKPYVSSPVIGVTKEKHIEDAIAACKIKLTEEDIKFIEEIYYSKATHPFSIYKIKPSLV